MTKAKSDASVVVSKNGPYIVSGGVPLSKMTIGVDSEGGSERWVDGAAYPVQEKYALCRCGESKKKPFCDGTHAKIGFDGTEVASRKPYLEQAKTFDGPTLDLTDVRGLCADGRFCDPNGKVWKQVERTDESAIRATFTRQVDNCPAGRLVAWHKATGKPLERDLPISIGLIEDPHQGCGGPIWLRGGIGVVSADGFAYEVRNRVTLCRCGQSRNKPFCDGTHASVKFQSQ